MPSRDLDFAAEFGNKPTGFRRRRPLCVQSSILLATSAVASLFTYWWFVSRNPSCSSVFSSAASLGGVSLSNEDVLRGEPTPRFRDNLHKDRKYITSWLSAGWTNDVMTVGNLLHLGQLTGRTTILPPFSPSHVGADAPLVPFSEIFDLPRLSAALGTPLVEWHEVKDIDSKEVDTLGCWSVWNTVRKEGPRKSILFDVQHLDVSYTDVPDWTLLGSDSHVTFARLSKLAFPEHRSRSLNTPHPSKSLNVSLPPDDQLLCYDFLYYVSTDEAYEYEHDYAPAWRNVMTHIHWNQRLQGMADDVVRHVLGLRAGVTIPPFISMHVRHGDFGDWCVGLEKSKCYAPLGTWSRHVDEVRAHLRQRGVRGSLPVVVTSDEDDEAWWAEVSAKGWYRVNHVELQTAEKYGKWYPVFLDAVIQGSGTGFLGTMKSTMSLLAKRRVEDWQNGVGQMVQWNAFNEHPEAISKRSTWLHAPSHDL